MTNSLVCCPSYINVYLETLFPSLVGVCIYVYIHPSMCVYVLCVCVYVHVVFFSPLYILRQSLSQNLELTISGRLAGTHFLGSSWDHFLCWHFILPHLAFEQLLRTQIKVAIVAQQAFYRLAHLLSPQGYSVPQ